MYNFLVKAPGYDPGKCIDIFTNKKGRKCVLVRWTNHKTSNGNYYEQIFYYDQVEIITPSWFLVRWIKKLFGIKSKNKVHKLLKK